MMVLTKPRVMFHRPPLKATFPAGLLFSAKTRRGLIELSGAALNAHLGT